MDNITTQKLEDMKQKIERMTKTNQIEVLKILKNDAAVVLNENKSGIYVNLSFLTVATLGQMNEFVEYVSDQEHTLMTAELQKDIFKNEFFADVGGNLRWREPMMEAPNPLSREQVEISR